MNEWWVRAEDGLGYGESWYGPFDQATAESFAIRLSKPIGAEEKFAELIYGKAGRHGKRFREYYQGKDYSIGHSGWHDVPPSAEILIPEAT